MNEKKLGHVAEFHDTLGFPQTRQKAASLFAPFPPLTTSPRSLQSPNSTFTSTLLPLLTSQPPLPPPLHYTMSGRGKGGKGLGKGGAKSVRLPFTVLARASFPPHPLTRPTDLFLLPFLHFTLGDTEKSCETTSRVSPSPLSDDLLDEVRLLDSAAMRHPSATRRTFVLLSCLASIVLQVVSSESRDSFTRKPEVFSRSSLKVSFLHFLI